MTHAPYELDVRPILRAGGEPLKEIMEAVGGLASGQALRLLATFQPVPLFTVLARKGFSHAAREIGDGDWEVIFTPAAPTVGLSPSETDYPAEPGHPASVWPEPARHLDDRDLDPPEPMVRTLAAAEELQPGDVLSALLCREPLFLLPELKNRGYEWQGKFQDDKTTYKLLVRKPAKNEAAE
jgi:uncharacterized protein (DUF2249 family)